MTYIHQNSHWPDLQCDTKALGIQLAAVRHRQGLLLGKLSSFGEALRGEVELATLTLEVVASSAFEGERLPVEEVRSSIARRLGIDVAGPASVSRAVEGVVGMMMDATDHDRRMAHRR